MAQGKIQKVIPSSITGKLTAASGFTLYDAVVKQEGEIVTIQGWVSGTFPADVETVFATITGVSLPKFVLRMLVGTGQNAWDAFNPAYMAVGTNGNLGIRPGSTAGKAVVFSFSYAAN